MVLGGGETFKSLRDSLIDRKDINYFGLDKVSLFAKRFSEEVDSPAVVAEASMLPFRDNSISAVNASAVFHEISSYGTRGRDGKDIRGLRAVDATLRDNGRILAPGGVLTYRDVACPENPLEKKRTLYSSATWGLFIENWLPQFEKVYGSIFPEVFDGCTVTESKDGLVTEGTAQLQREIQRHYITLRDFFRRSRAKDMGLTAVGEQWRSFSQGTKSHHLQLQGEAWKMYRSFRIEKSGDNAGSIEVPSFVYDDLTDGLLGEELNQNFHMFFSEWLKREGEEMYTYGNLETLSRMTEKESVQGSDDEKLRIDNSSEQYVPRNYYE